MSSTSLKEKVTELIHKIKSYNEEIISNISRKPKLYRLSRFWVYYRYFYHYIYSVIFLVFLIIALAGWNIAKGHLVLGSIISLLSSLSVVASYIMIIPWRKHPSSLILYRSLTSVVFSINIILNAIEIDDTQCRNHGVVTELVLLAGEAWLTTIAADLVASVTNPFTSYKANVRRYTVMVWTFTGFISFVLYFDKGCHGSFDNAICWVDVISNHSSCLWGYYLVWIILMYVYQMWASAFAFLRLSKGLPATFEIRKKCANETFQILSAYAIYLSIIMLFFIIVSTNPSAPEGSSMYNFGKFVLFIIANKGTVDGMVWFYIHNFDMAIQQNKTIQMKAQPVSQDEHIDTTTNATTTTTLTIAADSKVHGIPHTPSENDINVQYNPLLVKMQSDGSYEDDLDPSNSGSNTAAGAAGGGDIENNTSNNNNSNNNAYTNKVKQPKRGIKILTDEKEKQVKQEIQKIQHGFTKTITEIADMAIEDVEESDLSPQVNLALRQQIVAYVTSGVKESVKKTMSNNVFNRNEGSTRLPMSTQQIISKVDIRPDPAMVEGMPVLEFLLDNELPFKSFAPEIFRDLRYTENIDDEYYLQLLNSPANERLSEGASGAFMFFCGHGEFIVKTIRAREAKVLHLSLPLYADYLKKNKESLLCKFLGSYSLQVYSQTFYFVIMRNCFDPTADINERYDIKGSWVGRSADPSTNKKRATCRHCNTYFIPSKKEQCSVIVGRHEANVVLKDNDMHAKISLHPQEAKKILDILIKDSDLLGRLGVIDYSLLVGVKKWKFPIALTDEEIQSIRKPPKDNILRQHVTSIQPCYRAYSVSGPAVYYFGIVDFLQNWTFQKKVERTSKIYFLRKDPEGLSVMEPIGYKLRFQKKMKQIIDIDEKLQHRVYSYNIINNNNNSLPAILSTTTTTPVIPPTNGTMNTTTTTNMPFTSASAVTTDSNTFTTSFNNSHIESTKNTLSTTTTTTTSAPSTKKAVTVQHTTVNEEQRDDNVPVSLNETSSSFKSSLYSSNQTQQQLISQPFHSSSQQQQQQFVDGDKRGTTQMPLRGSKGSFRSSLYDDKVFENDNYNSGM